VDIDDTPAASSLAQRFVQRLGRSRDARVPRDTGLDVDSVDQLVRGIVERCDWLARDLRQLLAGHEDLPLRYIAEPARSRLRRAFASLWASDLRRKGDQTVTYNLTILGRNAGRTYASMTHRDDTRIYDSAGNLVAAPASDRSRRPRWEFRLTFDDPPEHIVEMSVHRIGVDTN
jgi:hypothetical protein